MSSPCSLWMAPSRSETHSTLPPRTCSISAAHAPTLPKPCIALSCHWCQCHIIYSFVRQGACDDHCSVAYMVGDPSSWISASCDCSLGSGHKRVLTSCIRGGQLTMAYQQLLHAYIMRGSPCHVLFLDVSDKAPAQGSCIALLAKLWYALS